VVPKGAAYDGVFFIQERAMQRTKSSGISFLRTFVMAATAVGIAAGVTHEWRAVAVHAETSSMAGEWVGRCQDGKAFMLLDLKPDANRYEGTVTLGAVGITSHSYEAETTCEVVRPVDAANPEQVHKITNALTGQEMLTFNVDQWKYEMKLTGGDTASVRFAPEPASKMSPWLVLQRAK
jgi:hypothetical protein